MPRTQSAAGDLVIVESTAKAKTIEQAVGPGFDGPAVVGHPDGRRTNCSCGIAR